MDAEVYIWIVSPSKGVEPVQIVYIAVVKRAYRRGDRKGERGDSPKFWLVTAMGFRGTQRDGASEPGTIFKRNAKRSSWTGNK
jgi:hypothetical protein